MAPSPSDYIERGTKLLTSLTGLYTKPKTTPPPITERTAILCSVLFTVLYIAPFYLSPTLRSTPLSSRNAPSVIQARVRAVFLTCFACTAITAFILIEYAHATTTDLLHLTGLWPFSALDCVSVLGLVAVLFIGPLFEALVADGGWRELGFYSLKESVWDSWIGYRNLVIAPLSEEVVFRALTIPLYLIARVDATKIVFVSPLIFGLAHVHHLVDFLKSHTLPGQKTPSAMIWFQGIVRSLFQFTYTSLFGFFEAFVFLRTGSLLATILAHSFCNCMGFPRVWGRVGVDEAPAHQVAPDVAQGKRDDAEGIVKVGNAALLPQEDAMHTTATVSRKSALWTVIYYTLLPVGAYGFYKLLWRFTESNYALAAFSVSVPSQL
ncbi:hypothetical protein AMS68_007567 [Peltaster fructicola]|uniref:intramembrane prenyl-peptidase Rce1 n=1 Tax=Peltaster fructicola TaxID=286661 RepID=A0A6H0Y626_9PEZI|nr:hypothetical protein AMS68_007567 [Peltaster fructicola]